MGEREAEVLGEELADVGALDILSLLELDNAENLSVEMLTKKKKKKNQLPQLWQAK